MDFEQWIYSHTNGRSPSPAIKRVIETISRSPDYAANSSANELAETAQVNIATLTRCAQFLGFKGWPAFSREIRQKVLDSSSHTPMFSNGLELPQGSFMESAIHDLRTLENADFEELNDSVRRAAKLLNPQSTVGVIATGIFLGPATSFAYGAQMMGLHTDLFDGTSTSVANKIRSFKSGDTLLAIDIWRTAKIVEKAAIHCKENNVNLIALCDRPTLISCIGQPTIWLPHDTSRFLPSLTSLTIACQAILSAYGAINPEIVEKSLADYATQMENWALIN